MEKFFILFFFIFIWSQSHIRTTKIPWTLDSGTNWRGGGVQILLNNLVQEPLKLEKINC